MISYYNNFDRKTHKWWKRIFMWILEVSQINSFIIYTLSRPRDSKVISLKSFKDSLISQLEEKPVNMYNAEKDFVPKPKGRPSIPTAAERLSNKRHLVLYDSNDRNCVFCSKLKERKRPTFRCSGCEGNPDLHPKECFYLYHTKK